MKIRKELWFGFSLMALIILGVVVMTPWGHISNVELERCSIATSARKYS